MKAGSTITLTVTGDASTANEPVLLSTIEVPVTRKVTEGRDAATLQHQKLLTDIKALCEKVSTTNVSPIALAIIRAIEHLRALGCPPSSACAVYVQTDLEENADARLKTAINTAGKLAKSSPMLIDNAGITVIFFGTAQTAGFKDTPEAKNRYLTKPRDQERAQRLLQAWRAAFSNPELVTFEPYCPKD